MDAYLKLATVLAAGTATFGCCTLFGGSPIHPDLRVINRLDDAIQLRFQEPLPTRLGMSRVMMPSSFGQHFRPLMSKRRDFEPENTVETEVIAALEQHKTQVGFYLIGAAILDSQPSLLDFRALKGPGIMTSGTPRPAWYPQVSKLVPPTPDALPDWNAIYPVALDAMKRFRKDGKPFETVLDTWTVAARPVTAGQQRCVTCHNNPAYQPSHPAKLGEAIGGVLYLFRTAPTARL